MSKSLIRFDWAMKRLLRSKAQFGILEGFLSVLLGETIKIQQILESASNQNDKYDKSNRVDLLVENSQQELIIIEVQTNRESDFISCILEGTSKTFIEHLKIGDPYSKVKKIICVSIVYFDLGHGDDYVYVGKTNFIGLHTQRELSLSEPEQLLYEGKQTVSEVYPTYYIIKVNQFDEVAKSPLDEWIYFLKTAQIKPTFKAPGLKKAKRELDVLKLSDKERAQYESYLNGLHYEASTLGLERELGRKEGFKEGISQGREEGLVEAREERLAEEQKQGATQASKIIALSLLKKGVDMRVISKTTGLSIEDLKHLM